MPTPVKNSFPSPAAAPARAGAASPASDAASGESFQDELVRRRRVETAAKPDPTPASRKAEPKRVTKPRQSHRVARGKPGARPEELDVSMAEAGEAGAEARGPSEVVEGDATATDEGHAADESAGAGAREADSGHDEASVVSAGIMAAPTTDPATREPPTDAASEGDAGEAAPGATTDDLLRARSVAYAGGKADAEAVPGDAPSGPATTPARNAPALFADGAPQEGAASAEKQGAKAPSTTTVASPADPAALPPQFQTAAVPADHRPGFETVPTDAAPDAVASGLLNPQTESRHAAAPAAPAAPPVPPEVRFATANHENIVTSMRAEVLPNGGSMRIRLDPPQLGALQVIVQVRDGLVTAAFETSNDEATRLLGHSLNQLKSVLESHGVAVDKLQVQQAPRDANPSGANDDARRDQGGHSHEQEQHARQEQQRREMLQKMWRRLAGEQDPLDLTA
jgi:flagellar hook-length control protein FliK